MPLAFNSEFAIPPPTIKWFVLSARFSNRSIFVDTFEPPTTATIGFCVFFVILSRASISAIRSGPAQDCSINDTAPAVEAWARCAVAKASLT